MRDKNFGMIDTITSTEIQNLENFLRFFFG